MPGRNAGDAGDGSAGPCDRLAPTDHRLRHELRGDLHARHEVAGPDDLAVVDGEHLERIDPVQTLERADPDPDDSSHRGVQVDPALGRSAQLEARTGHGGGQAQGGLVLVEIAGLRDEHDERRLRARSRQRDRAFGGETREIVPGQAAALRPALTAHAQVARQHRPDEIARRRAAENQALEAHSCRVRPL